MRPESIGVYLFTSSRDTSRSREKWVLLEEERDGAKGSGAASTEGDKGDTMGKLVSIMRDEWDEEV